MLVRDKRIEKMFLEPQKPGDPFEVSDADTMLDYLAPGTKRPDQIAILTREAARSAPRPRRCSTRPARIRRGAAAAHRAQQGARAIAKAGRCRRCSSTASWSEIRRSWRHGWDPRRGLRA
jgi:hypothetical protein